MAKQVILDWHEYQQLKEKESLQEWAGHQILVHQDKVVVGDTIATQQFEMGAFGATLEVVSTVKRIK